MSLTVPLRFASIAEYLDQYGDPLHAREVGCDDVSFSHPRPVPPHLYAPDAIVLASRFL